MEDTQRIASETAEISTGSIVNWIDSLAKTIVIISSLLYIIGRSYTEGYYSHMGIPTTNLPLNLQEYLFMSTKSLSFLKNAVYSSLISVITGFVFSFALSGAKTFMANLISKYSKKSKNKKQATPNTDKPIVSDNGDKPESKVNLDTLEIKKELKKTANNKDMILEFQSRIKDWFTSRLIYIIPTFILLVFILLIPSARESGRVDAEYDLQYAPLGRVLLNQPSIPELSAQVHIMQTNSSLYDYGILPVIGTLGDNYLLVLKDQNGKKSVLSVSASQVVSINYVDYVSLTPIPKSTAALIATPIPTVTAPPKPNQP